MKILIQSPLFRFAAAFGVWLFGGLVVNMPVYGGDASGVGVDDFELLTYQGRQVSLYDEAGDLGVVVAFLGTECPLAKLYGPRLTSISAQFKASGITVLGVVSNSQDSMRDVRDYVERHAIDFPIVMDVGNRVADAMGAQRTPEVFLLSKDHRVVYQGRIDDQYGVGYSRSAPKEHFLQDAIVALVAGQRIRCAATEPVGCFIGRSIRAPSTGDITYHNQIAPILDARCVECHREKTMAPFALNDYNEIVGWGETILEVVENGRMPPWYANPKYGEFSNDCRLSTSEKSLIRRWVRNGMPEGDKEESTVVPRTYDSDWRMKEPNLVLSMDREFDVPATGVVDYQYFFLDPGWAEDHYIQSVDVRPGNPKIVHHILAYLILPGQQRHRFDRDLLLAIFAPGTPMRTLPDGFAMHAPAGSRIMLEVHYSPIGEAQTDLSSIAFKFCRDVGVRHILTRMVPNFSFLIPPNDANFEVQSEYISRTDETLVELFPHMHLRGKSFRFTAKFPSGEEEVLLDVPNYDFNWQLTYALKKPRLLPKGTRVVCDAVFDNSAENATNPDSNLAVKFGRQSWDEMMLGVMQVVPHGSSCMCRSVPSEGLYGKLCRLLTRLEAVFLRWVYVPWVRYQAVLATILGFCIAFWLWHRFRKLRFPSRVQP